MAAAVAAAIARERRRVVAVLREAGATSAQQAAAPDRLAHVRFHVVARLEARGVVRRAADARFYLDEAAWAAYHARLRRIALTLVVVSLVVILVMVGLALLRVA